MTMEGEKLLRAAGMGNVEAFEELTGDYLKIVYNMILASCGRSENISELAQEVFVRVFKNMKAIKSINALGTSVYKTVRDVCSENPGRIKKIS